MSLLIDTDTMTGVLLADGWHEVKPGTFYLDSYEFGIWHPVNRDDFRVSHGGGNSGICATGFTFTDDDGGRIVGPLTAILAVRAAEIPG